MVCADEVKLQVLDHAFALRHEVRNDNALAGCPNSPVPLQGSVHMSRMHFGLTHRITEDRKIGWHCAAESPQAVFAHDREACRGIAHPAMLHLPKYWTHYVGNAAGRAGGHNSIIFRRSDAQRAALCVHSKTEGGIQWTGRLD